MEMVTKVACNSSHTIVPWAIFLELTIFMLWCKRAVSNENSGDLIAEPIFLASSAVLTLLKL
jgi:hypothetical protein